MKKGIVIDLDGTLLNTNTFEEYILFVFWQLIRKCQFVKATFLCIFVLCRKLRLISHSMMKYHVLRCSQSQMNTVLLKKFVDKLMTRENVEVKRVFERYKKTGYFTCLSTAAPCCYANVIAERLGFNGVCATPHAGDTREGWLENAKDTKASKTLDFLATKQAELSVFVTDHFDDLPLLKVKKEQNYLVNPSAKTLAYCKKNDIPVELLLAN